MHFTPDWILAVCSFIALLLAPSLVFLVRGAIKWTKVESKLDDVVEQLTRIANDGKEDREELITTMNKTHAEIYNQMAEDRKSADQTHKAFDERLRFMEQFWMNAGLKQHFDK